MWYSLGDKYEVIKHDNSKRPRKFKSTIFVLIALVGLFLANSHIFITALPASAFYQHIPLILTILSMAILLIVVVLKYIKNKGEIDMLLITVLFFCILMLYIFS